MLKIIGLLGAMFMISCSSLPKYEETVSHLDIEKFMGKWYVMAGRFTPLERDVHNGIEVYEYDRNEDKIKISFDYNKGSFDGDKKSIPQTGWIYNKTTNSHWKVSPFWPLKFDYLVIGLATDYSWTVIGVPNQSYVWIMARNPMMSKEELDKVINLMKAKKYNMENLVTVPHKH